MSTLIVYIHGKGGSAKEAEHYRPLFPDGDVIGLTYKAAAPWEAKEEFPALLRAAREGYDHLILIANSIGAYFAMQALSEERIDKAYLISPITDMEKLIREMMRSAGVTESELEEKGEIPTPFGETLSWKYLSYVRAHPIEWKVPTEILCGEKDRLISEETIRSFARRSGANLTVMAGGEHWFHTEEQMAFLDEWITKR